MKKYIRIIIPILLFIVLAGFILLFPDVDSGNDKKDEDKNTDYSTGLNYGIYNENDKFATVHGIGDCKDSKIIIPEKDDYGREVTTLYQFSIMDDCSHITEIILPETLRWCHFHYLDITQRIPNLKFNEYGNAKYLGTNNNPYFALITSLDTESTEAIIHPDTKIIAVQAFKGKDNLKTINIPEGVRFLSSSAFMGCKNLINLTIPKSLLAQNEAAFAECTSLKSVTIPGTLKTIDSHMFAKCTALETVIIEEGTETIGYRAFSGCTALKNVILPSGVKTVSISAFSKCSSLTEIAFSDGLELIASSAFDRCSNLEKIVVPNSLKAVVNYAFDNCDKLKYNIYENALYLGNEENPYVALIKPINNDVSTIAIPGTTSAIMYGAFKDCAKLKTVSIPEGVTIIGQNTFKGCAALSKVEIPSTVNSIHHWTFKDCVSLSSIEFGGTIEQWNLMKESELGRAQGWAEGSNIGKVYCSDGVIEITTEDR